MSDNVDIKIGGVETFSTVDYPGKMSAVIFMQGCPWRCPFCYNASLQNINATPETSWEKIFSFIKRRKGILNAVVFSGGEPLMQDNIIGAITSVRDLSTYAIGLHTGGYKPMLLEKVLPLLSWVGFDIKAPLEEESYKKAIGHQASFLPQVLESLNLLINSKISFECRTTCDPRILSIDDIYKIAGSLKEKGVNNFYLQKYRPIPGDRTEDFECEKFFQDKKLEEFLRSSFEHFDFRK